MKDSSIFLSSLDEVLGVFGSLIHLEDKLNQVIEIIAECLKDGNKLLFCGNGGSAADSMHIATEFTCRFKRNRRPYPAIALTTDGGLLTAIGNDFSFDDIFSRQIDALGNRGDVLFALSTSGNSFNVYSAISIAQEKGIKTIALLGKDGGCIKNIADLSLIINSDSTARIQEAHKFLLHVLCERIDEMTVTFV